MKLGYSIIYVNSVPKTVTFYYTAFGIGTRFCTPGDEYAEMEMEGTTTLAFADEKFVGGNIGANIFQPNRLESQTSPGAEISLVVDMDKEETVEGVVKKAVEHGAVLVKEAMTKPWGQVVAYLKDCNGFLIEVCTPVQPTLK